jgi:hypothetical protein
VGTLFKRELYTWSADVLSCVSYGPHILLQIEKLLPMWECMIQIVDETLKDWITKKDKSKKESAQLDEHIA